MNFNIIEGEYTDFEKIHDDFCNDYLFSTELSNIEIRRKYNLTAWDFKKFCEEVKKEYGVTRRNKSGSGKYYYKAMYGWTVRKRIDGKQVYLGHVPTAEIAAKVVEKCKKARWDIDVCRDIVGNWEDYL